MAVILLALSLFASVACNAVETSQVTSFSDVPQTHWGYETIMDMTERGLFKGTTEPVNGVGTFSPDKVMTRAEFVTVAMRATFPVEAQSMDTVGVQWWEGFYSLALEKGILKANELNNGDLGQPMSREEMAMVLVRCVEKNGETLSERVEISKIADYYSITDYYKDYVRDCFSFGLLCGIDSIGTFAPAKSLTRAEGSTVLCRLLDKETRVAVSFEDVIVLEESESEEDSEPMPWEDGEKNPEEYSYDEFEKLTEEQRISFQESFGSDEKFTEWLNGATGTKPEQSVPETGKTLSEYSYAEYQAMTLDQQLAFQESFGSDEEFTKWLNKATGLEPELPWENGGKQPSKYTYAEYEALTIEQQLAFQESFESFDAFDKWLQSVT